MFRTFLTFAVIAALVYGAYQVNVKYFAVAAPAAKAQVDPAAVSFVCPADIDAFDPTEPKKAIGRFTKGTEIKIGSTSMVEGMKNVFYQPPDGSKVIEALCKEADLTDKPAATAPLAKSDKKSVIPDNPALKKDADRSWLGNGQTTIQQGNGGGVPGTGAGGNVIRMGQSNAKKTIDQTFGGQLPPPPQPSLSPEQGIKERAKDLQNSQSQPPSSP